MTKIKLAILHGSRATGKARPDSDWDVAVLGENKLEWDEISGLKEIFAKQFKVSEEKIDIADLNSDSPMLNFQVAATGKLLQGERGDYINFKLAAWKDYLNNEEIFDLRSKFLQKHLG